MSDVSKLTNSVRVHVQCATAPRPSQELYSDGPRTVLVDLRTHLLTLYSQLLFEDVQRQGIEVFAVVHESDEHDWARTESCIKNCAFPRHV